MDEGAATLQGKLRQLLREAAEVAAALDRAEGAVVGAPHYSVIEARAHELGRQLSRQIQSRHMGLVAAAATVAACPGCDARCEVRVKRRDVVSVDGPVALEEAVASCPGCRRDFFPPPGSARP